MESVVQVRRSVGNPPLPLTVNLVEAVGASMKQAGYTSAKAYMSRAEQEHVLTYGAKPDAKTLLCMKNVLRSITRGAGAPALKTGFVIEQLCHLPEQKLTTATPSLFDSDIDDGIILPLHMTITGT